MRDLYSRADAVLRGANPEAISAGSAMRRQLVREGLVFWSDKEFAAHVSNLPVSYWRSFDTPSQIAHANCRVNSAGGGANLMISARMLSTRSLK